MSNIAFIFPGQGAQYPSMGKELYDNFSEARVVFEIADASLPFSVTELCFNASEDVLNSTEYTQPSILTTSIAAYKVFEKHNIKPSFTAGLSLGEYSALVSCDVLDLATAVPLVYNRGKFMESAVPKGQGGMAAIIGLDKNQVQDVCEKAKIKGVVEPANYNYPGQIVIGGEMEAIDLACEISIECGAKKAIKLNVSGPFHTSLLKKASIELDEYIKNIEFRQWSTPIVSNVTARPYKDVSEISDILTKQVISSVLWDDSIKYMIDQGINQFIEIGPGKTLSSFIKRIDRTVSVTNISDIKSLENTLKKLGG